MVPEIACGILIESRALLQNAKTIMQEFDGLAGHDRRSCKLLLFKGQAAYLRAQDYVDGLLLQVDENSLYQLGTNGFGRLC